MMQYIDLRADRLQNPQRERGLADYESHAA